MKQSLPVSSTTELIVLMWNTFVIAKNLQAGTTQKIFSQSASIVIKNVQAN